METQVQTTEIIPINATVIAGTQNNTVNARDLHNFLNVGKDFSNWLKDRIRDYGFIESQDYVKFSPNSAKTPNGGRPAIEYHVTLDMAKELSMVERTEKGKEARKYFIECERRLRTIAQKTSLPIDEMWKLMRAVLHIIKAMSSPISAFFLCANRLTVKHCYTQTEVSHE